jgi:hypothetical protein
MEEMPFGNQFEKAVWNFNKAAGKRAFADTVNSVYRMLSHGTEPFFRCEMGERHFSGGAATFGLMLWACTTIVSCLTPSLSGLLFYMVGWSSLARVLNSFLIPLVIGGTLYVIYYRFTKQNTQWIAQIRGEGKTHHSKSRGRPRWPDPAQERAIRIGGSVALLLLAPLAGIAFIASIYVSATLVAQQQAEMQSRYLDALDAQIEGKFLQDALLGKCPPELTFLYKPLSNSIKPELREEIAAAAVGKPVKIVAQRPVRSRAPSAREVPEEQRLDPEPNEAPATIPVSKSLGELVEAPVSAQAVAEPPALAPKVLPKMEPAPAPEEQVRIRIPETAPARPLPRRPFPPEYMALIDGLLAPKFIDMIRDVWMARPDEFPSVEQFRRNLETFRAERCGNLQEGLAWMIKQK